MKLPDFKRYASWIICLGVVLLFAVTVPRFRTVSNFTTILRQVAAVGIMASGLAMVLLTGGIDLSIGVMLGLTGSFTAILMTRFHIPVYPAMFCGIALGTFVGLVNGVIITYTKMPPIIATLGMANVVRGSAYLITGGNPVYGLPKSVTFIGQGYAGVIPVSVIIMVIVLLVVAFILNKTFFGRYIYAIGSNEEAARLGGLRVNRIRVLVYTFCGGLMGLAGIVMLSRVNSGQPIAGYGMEMDIITACVLGGVSASGGEGRISGVIGGVLAMGALSNGMAVMGLNEYPQLVMKGVVLVVAVSIDYYTKTRSKRVKVIKNSGKNQVQAN
jgi:ribose/xylose/arabinose/galactoside ABC-type transport system permease subunit